MQISEERVREPFRPGSIAVVTGGAQGIGRAIAEVLAEEGLKVAIWDLNLELAREAAAFINERGGEAVAFQVDITDDDAISTAWAAVRQIGTCPYLVNNAGVPSVLDITMAEGLAGTIGGTVSVTEKWLETFPNDASSVVHISSIAGNEIGGGFLKSYYPVGKGAISAYSRHLAVREAGHPRSNSVAPGFTLTPRSAPRFNEPGTAFSAWVDRGPMKRPGYPHEMAEVVAFLLSERASFLSGEHIRVDGAFVLAD